MENVSGTVDSINLWGTTLLNAMTALWSKVAAFIPNLLAFFVILVIGYLVARLLASVMRRVLEAIHIDRFSQRVGVRSVLDGANIQAEVSTMLSRLVFWLLMLTFLVSATETLGLPRVSSTIDGFVQYLPKVLGAVFILLVGLFIAQFVRGIIVGGSESLGLESAGTLGAAAYGLLVIIVGTLAIGQLELETEILNQVIAIVLISLGGAAALAFGLGSKLVAGNILAGTYARELYREGDDLVIGDVRGTVTQVTAVKLEIRTEEGDLITVPNVEVINTTVRRMSG